MTQPYRLFGGLGSPYSLKMRAVLRYRRLPHIWIQIDRSHASVMAAVKTPVIPVLQFPDGDFQNDSTLLIEALEARHAERPIIPPDPGVALLVALLEDMADEWATKAMYFYRWNDPRDQERMSQWLAFDRLRGSGRDRIEALAGRLRERQAGRLDLVMGGAANADLLVETTHRLLAIFEAHVSEQPYLFGSIPSAAEFAWYGQFAQMIGDPTPGELMRSIAPFTTRWTMQLDDASGVEGEWRDPNAPLPDAVEALLRFAGEVYLPYLVANARAVSAGEDRFTAELPGRPWTQGTVRYQAKCLAALRTRFAALPEDSRRRIAPLLERTDCLPHLA